MASFEYVALALVDEIERRNNLHKRVYRDAQDPFSLSDSTFEKLFRISKNIFSILLERLLNSLPPYGIPPHLRILVALRFYATGKLQSSVAKDIFISLSQPSVSRCINTVSKAIDTVLSDEFVRFPTTLSEQVDVKTKFLKECEFPGVLGVIGCTHIATKSHTVDTSCINYKAVKSVKVQMIADSSLRILAIDAESPGSTDDAIIWYQNRIRCILSQQEKSLTPSWILGDNSYPLEPWLLIPFVNPDDSEEVFNRRHAAASKCFKECEAMLKSRFCCLSQRQYFSYSPPQSTHIINACAVLHNLCIAHNVRMVEECNMEDEREDSDGDSTDNENKLKESSGENDDIINDISGSNTVAAEFVRQDILKFMLK